MTLPNLLTGMRLLAIPVLLGVAWLNHPVAFMVLLAFCFLTDVLDGLAARLTGQATEFGAHLDSLADALMYLTISLCSWWLWPDIVRREMVYVGLVIASCVLPAIAGYGKFGCFTSYHTWAVKFAAAVVGSSLFILFLAGPAWPFQVAAVLSLLAALEEIALTLLLAEPQSNIRSIWTVLRGKYR